MDISYAILTPAYGRDYNSSKQVIDDFKAGKDFIFNSFQGSTYCSIKDFDNTICKQVKLRYKKNTKTTIYKFEAKNDN